MTRTCSSTVTTSGGPLKLDGQTGVQIQEDGTTVIGVDSDRNVALGNVSNPEDIYFSHPPPQYLFESSKLR